MQIFYFVFSSMRMRDWLWETSDTIERDSLESRAGELRAWYTYHLLNMCLENIEFLLFFLVFFL